MQYAILVCLVVSVVCYKPHFNTYPNGTGGGGNSDELDVGYGRKIPELPRVIPSQGQLIQKTDYPVGVRRVIGTNETADCVNGTSLRTGRRCLLFDIVGGLLNIGTNIAGAMYNGFIRCPFNTILSLVKNLARCYCRCVSSVWSCRAHNECGMPTYEEGKCFRIQGGCLLCQYVAYKESVCIKMTKCIKYPSRKRRKIDAELMDEIIRKIEIKGSTGSESDEDEDDERMKKKKKPKNNKKKGGKKKWYDESKEDSELEESESEEKPRKKKKDKKKKYDSESESEEEKSNKKKDKKKRKKKKEESESESEEKNKKKKKKKPEPESESEEIKKKKDKDKKGKKKKDESASESSESSKKKKDKEKKDKKKTEDDSESSESSKKKKDKEKKDKKKNDDDSSENSKEKKDEEKKGKKKKDDDSSESSKKKKDKEKKDKKKNDDDSSENSKEKKDEEKKGKKKKGDDSSENSKEEKVKEKKDKKKKDDDSESSEKNKKGKDSDEDDDEKLKGTFKETEYTKDEESSKKKHTAEKKTKIDMNIVKKKRKRLKSKPGQLYRMECTEGMRVIHNTYPYPGQCQVCSCQKGDYLCQIHDKDCSNIDRANSWCLDDTMKHKPVSFHHNCFSCQCKGATMHCVPNYNPKTVNEKSQCAFALPPYKQEDFLTTVP